MNLAISKCPVPACINCMQAAKATPAARLHRRSCIHVIYADPVVVPVNTCSRDLVKLLQLLAADLAYLAIRHLDLAVIA